MIGLLSGSGYRSRDLIRLTLCEKCAHTLECVGTALKLEASYKPLLFFVLRGCLIPNLDDTFYFILTKDFELSQEYYDQMIIYQAVGILLFSIFYFCVLQKYQISKIIALQLLIELTVTGLAYDGFVRTGWQPSVSIAIVAGKASFMGLAMLPMLVELT